MIDAATPANTTDLLATTNAQPDKLGVPLTPGMTTVVLGQKEEDDQTKRCAWFCSADTLSCEDICWAVNGSQDAAVEDGGSLSEHDAIEGLAECQVVDKGGVGRLVVCAVAVVDGGYARGSDGEGMDGMRCVLFWRGRKPCLVCRKVAR